MPDRRTTRTGGRGATTGLIPGDYALSVGLPDSQPPGEWEWTLLTDVARLESGHTPSRKHPEYWDGVIPWIGIRDATANHGRTLGDTAQHVTSEGIDNSSARVLPENTVCLSRTASVGYVVVMGRPMATSQDFVNWVCGDQLDWRFLKYVLLAERSSYERFSHGTTHQTIYFPEVKAFHVCLPPLDEQRRIAGVLGALDDKIDLNRRMSARLNEILHLLYVRLQAERDETWTEVEIGSAVTVVGGSTPSTKESSYWDGEIPFVTPKDLASLEVPVLMRSERLITEEGLAQISSGLLPRETTVLMSSRAPIGYIARPSIDVSVNQGFIAMICDGTIGPNYAMQWAQHNIEAFKNRANGTTFLEISKAAFRPILIPVPPAGQRDVFEEDASRYFDLMQALAAETERLQGTRDLLLPLLISGELRLPSSYAGLPESGPKPALAEVG